MVLNPLKKGVQHPCWVPCTSGIRHGKTAMTLNQSQPFGESTCHIPTAFLEISRSCPQSLSCSEKGGEDRVERALGQEFRSGGSGQSSQELSSAPFTYALQVSHSSFPTLTQGLGPELQDKELRIEQTMPGMRGSGDRHILSKSAGSHEVCGQNCPQPIPKTFFPGRSLCTREWFPMCQQK